MCVCKNFKKQTIHQADEKRPQWYNDILDKRAKTKADKSKKTEWQGMGSRAVSNQQCKSRTTVDKNKVSTRLTHETPFTAEVEAAATITNVFIPPPYVTNQCTAIIDSGATSCCGQPDDHSLPQDGSQQKYFKCHWGKKLWQQSRRKYSTICDHSQIW